MYIPLVLTLWIRPAMRCVPHGLPPPTVLPAHFAAAFESEKRAIPPRIRPVDSLILLLASFLAAALARQRFFYALSFPGLQVERVTFYFLDDVLGLHLPLKSAKRILERFPFLQSNFSQRTTPPYWSWRDLLVMSSFTLLSQAECAEFFRKLA